MKVTINPDGTPTFEDVSVDEGLAIMDKIRERAAAQANSTPAPDPSMNAKYYQTWTCLVENDCELGVSLHHVARALNISPEAATQRLGAMVKRGTARRVSVGHYRPLEHAGE